MKIAIEAPISLYTNMAAVSVFLCNLEGDDVTWKHSIDTSVWFVDSRVVELLYYL